MAKVFYAKNRHTGERWKSDTKGSFLVMYDSGGLAEVSNDFYTYVVPLDPAIWKTMVKDNIDKFKSAYKK